MNYPIFQDLLISIPIEPAKNVFRIFPESVIDKFDKSSFYPNHLFDSKKIPVVSGFITGKAYGRYQRCEFVLGFSLLFVSGGDFMVPFYADSNLGKGFVDTNRAISLENYESMFDNSLTSSILDLKLHDSKGGIILDSGFEKLGTFLGTLM
jgi:hypothetical protein